jgi:hypothetical protein
MNYVIAGIFLMLASCSSAPRPTVEVKATFGATLQGRPFIFQILEAKGDRFLQIEGDNAIISYYSSNGPYVPVISTDTIEFGGHKLGVTATPNLFKVKNQNVRLEPHGLYIFADGEYQGRYR